MVFENWTSTVVNSLQNLWLGTMGVIANMLGAVIVLLVGLVVAGGLGALVERLVAMVKLDKLLSSLGFNEYFERAGLSVNSGKFFGKIVYWFLVLVFLLAATDILGFYSLSAFLKEALLYVPNVIVAVLIMLAAVVIANVLRKIVSATIKGSRLSAAGFLSTLTWWAVVIFGLLATLTQLGIAVSIIQALVTGFMAMLAIAGGIAFGLGGKDYAAYLINKMKDHTG
ncbi:MAG: hypothetical protein NTZ36_03220 [Candidatus Jorgensenbacteria bacterium]|nr:hypothetical protein [Candidatus Jorgensenbacteria bacterium]